MRTNEVAFAYLDVSTGDGFTTILTGDEKEVVQELLAIQAKELIVSEQMYVLINDLSAIHDFTVSIEKEELSDDEIHKYVPNHPDQTHQTVKTTITIHSKNTKTIPFTYSAFHLSTKRILFSDGLSF